MHRYISTKVLLAEGRETPFAEHCRNYENTYRVGSAGQDGMGGTGRCCSRGGGAPALQMLQTEIQGLKDQVQELHRDLTKHHSLIKTEIMSEILQKSLQMDVQIAAHYSAVEMMRSVFEEVRPAEQGPSAAQGPSMAQGPSVLRRSALPGSLSLFQVWEETYQRVANEQEIYEGTDDPHPRAPCANPAAVAAARPLARSPAP